MKFKRSFCLLIAALLLITAVPLTTASGAVFFTMINSNAPETLQASTMPFTRSGRVYVPMSALGRLGVVSMVQPRAVRLSLSHDTDIYVHFDLDEGTAITNTGASMSVSPVYRFGTFFFPVGTTGSATGVLPAHFGVSFHIIHCEPAPIVRLYNQSVGSLTHDALLQNGAHLFSLQVRYNAFVGADDPPAPPIPPTGGNPPVVDDTPDQPQAPVSLSFVGLTENTATLLDELRQSGIPAGFFLTAECALNHSDLVRRIHGEGHQVGIFLTEDAETAYLEASAALFAAARLRTVLVAAETPEIAQEAETLGLIVYDTPVRRYFYPNGTTGLAGNLLLDKESVGTYTLNALPRLIRSGTYHVIRLVNVIF